MNTVKIGDRFEDKSYDLIQKAIQNDELGISKNGAKVFRQKGYYSKDREKEIIFDLAIEIWPKGAKRWALLYLIECKSSPSKHNVPVDDVEEFYTKMNQVGGGAVKGVMITDNKFQSGGLTFAKNKRMMLIEVDKDDNYSIILHKTEREKKLVENEFVIDDLVQRLIMKTLGNRKVEGLKNLFAEQIEEIALSIINDYYKFYPSFEINNLVDYVNIKYSLSFDFTKSLRTVNGKKISGYFDVERKEIFIDESIISSEQFPFILGHELGHFFLHSNLKMNQEQYDNFEDSKYNIFTKKYDLTNDKNWIEWQANKFSIGLLLPKVIFVPQFIAIREIMGISRANHIYLDDQPINIRDYLETIDQLAKFFGTSKTSIKYRIEELKLITHKKSNEIPTNDFRSNIMKMFNQ